jgi:OsmC-like protein
MDRASYRLRITSTTSDAARVTARRHQFAVGRPIDFDAEYPHVTALEYALGALGAEVVSGLRMFAKRRRIEIDEIEAIVDGEVANPLTYLEVVGESGHPGLARVFIKVYVASPGDEQTLNQLWHETLERLPLVRTFRNLLNLSIELALTA